MQQKQEQNFAEFRRNQSNKRSRNMSNDRGRGRRQGAVAGDRGAGGLTKTGIIELRQGIEVVLLSVGLKGLVDTSERVA